MTDTEGYNGWKNYETWCVSLWLGDEQGTNSDVHIIAEDLVIRSRRDEDGEWTRTGRTLAGALADALKDYVEEMPEYASVRETASFVSDLLGAALSEVDWYEMAENLLSEVELPEDDEEES